MCLGKPELKGTNTTWGGGITDFADEFQVFVAGKGVILQAVICFLVPQAPLHMKLCQRLRATRLRDNRRMIKSQNVHLLFNALNLFKCSYWCTDTSAKYWYFGKFPLLTGIGRHWLLTQFLILKLVLVQNFTNAVFLNITPLLFVKAKYFICMYNWRIKIKNFTHCRMASCWADCPSACTCSLRRDVEQLASLASAWPPPTCPAGCNSQPAEGKTKACENHFHNPRQAGRRMYRLLERTTSQ